MWENFIFRANFRKKVYSQNLWNNFFVLGENIANAFKNKVTLQFFLKFNLFVWKILKLIFYSYHFMFIVPWVSTHK